MGRRHDGLFTALTTTLFHTCLRSYLFPLISISTLLGRRPWLSACCMLFGFLGGLCPSLASLPTTERSSNRYIRQLDDLSALWSFYKQTYIVNGRIVSWDEQGVTTSEGQGYAMLRAVWSGIGRLCRSEHMGGRPHHQNPQQPRDGGPSPGGPGEKSAAPSPPPAPDSSLSSAPNRFGRDREPSTHRDLARSFHMRSWLLGRRGTAS